MKRWSACFLCMIVLMIGLTVSADATGTDFVIENGVLTRYQGSGGDVTIPNGVTSIGFLAFGNCRSLMSVTIPNSVTHIGDYAFGYCSSLTSVTIPSSVTSIGGWAFRDCSSLTSVTIPNSVTSIGGGAFEGCSSLTSVTIPNSVTSIGNGAFADCDSLTSVNVDPDNASFSSINGVLFNKQQTELLQYPGASKGRYLIPNSVTSIGDEAFLGCSNLTSVTIPNSVTSIGGGTFEGCSSLTSVTIPNSVTSIGDSVFYYCSSLTSVTIPSGVTSIGAWAFHGCDSLADIYYGGSEAQLRTIAVSGGNDPLMYATIHYISTNVKQDVQPFVPVYSTDETVVLDAALSQYNFTDMLPDITSGMDTLRGPSITVAGETFYLFEMESSLEIPLGDKVTIQAKADYEEKTIKILAGYKYASGGTTIVGDPNSPEDQDNDFWKSYTDAKDLYKLVTGNSANSAAFRSRFQNAYDKMQEFDMDLIVKATGKVSLYAELSYETGKLKFSEGGGILAVSLKSTTNGRIPSFPAAYVTLRFEMSAEGRLMVVADETTSSGLNTDLQIDASLGAAIGVGLGKNTGQFQAYIEGGFDGTLGAYIRPWRVAGIDDEDPFSVDLTGDLYFAWKLKAWLLENGDTYKKNLFKLGLYPRLELLSTMESGQLTMEDFLASAKPITRDYLNSVSLMAISDDYTFSKVEYPFAEPTLVRLSDGRVLMVWVGDSGIKADGDRTSIYYSVYSDGAWSSPTIVHESETYNDHPVLYQDGNMVYMVWMRADTALNGMEAEVALAHMDLVFSSFNGTLWSEPEIVSQSNNGRTEIDYAVTANNGTVSVVWLENSLNDLLMTDGENSIHQRSRADGKWGFESVIYKTSDVVTGLGAYQSDGIQVTFSVTSNGTTTTYLRGADETVSVVDGADREARWINGNLYELRDTALYCNGYPTGLEGITNFEIISSNTQTVALTLVPIGFTCELFGSYYDSGNNSWGAWVQLTGFKKYIRSYSAVLDESGKIVAALNLVNVNADADRVYDNTSAVLAVVDDCSYNDLVVADWLSYDDSLIAPNALLPISFQVTNNSAERLTQMTVSMNGQSQPVPCDLMSGETAVLTVNYHLPANIGGHTITLTVSPGYSGTESSTANNAATTTLGLADLVVTASAPEWDGNGATVAIHISNVGYLDAENVILTAYRSNMSGDVLQAENLGTIDAGSSTNYVLPVPVDMLFLDDPDTMYALNFEAVADSDERELANNSDRIAFGNILPLQIIHSIDDDSIRLNVSVENRQEVEIESTLIAAVYTSNGRMVETQAKALQTDADEQSTVSFEINRNNYEGEICIKVFWIKQDSCAPITIAWERTFSPN